MFADVTSANTVGFQTVNFTRGNYNMFNVSFESVDGKGMMPSTALTGNFTSGASYALSDHFEIYDPATESYKYYWYFNGKWVDQNSRSKTLESVYTDGFPAGTVIWYLSKGSGTVTCTQSGGVLGQDDATVEVACGNYNMICNPFPVAWGPNDHEKVDWTGAKSGASYALADHIEYYDAATEGYKYFWLYSGTGKWVTQNNRSITFEQEIGNVDAMTGNGLWYLSKGTSGEFVDEDDVAWFDVTFYSPLTK